MSQALIDEITRRAHFVEPQGDGIYMVLIRMDEILTAVRLVKRRTTAASIAASKKGWRTRKRLIKSKKSK